MIAVQQHRIAIAFIWTSQTLKVQRRDQLLGSPMNTIVRPVSLSNTSSRIHGSSSPPIKGRLPSIIGKPRMEVSGERQGFVRNQRFGYAFHHDAHEAEPRD